MRLVHPASGRVLAERLEVPRTFIGRGLGLMFRRAVEPGGGMWLKTNGIHMFFMRIPIDALFLDRQERVRKVYRHLKPWRVVPLVWGAYGVAELPAGTLDGLDLPRGEQLRLE
jgi:uncharacterized protein